MKRKQPTSVVVLVVVFLVSLAQPVLAADPESLDGYVFQERALRPLKDAHQSVLVGKRNRDGSCHYDYPEITVSESGVIIEVRDVGIDANRCRKIIEQGVSTESWTGPGDGEAQDITNVDDGPPPNGGSGAMAITSTASGYNWTWWEDVLGIKMTQDKTHISWSYNGSCALSGSTSGEWIWAYGTGWQIVSNSANEQEACSAYRGESKSTFKNSWFCSPLPTVYTYYYYVRAYGQENGSITGTRSTDSVNECAPFWMHYSVKKVT